MSAPGPLGWIAPEFRTQAQNDAHERALAVMPRLNYVNPGLVKTLADLPKGAKVMLTDFWSKPEVIEDIGKAFTGFGQKTGSCVGVSEGNAATTALCVNRCVDTNPTRAGVVFWPFAYGRCRFNEGDRGPGEGAVDSVMGETLVNEGFFEITEPGLPGFTWDEDGLWIAGGAQTEIQWSYIPDNGPLAKWKEVAARRAGMTKVIVSTPEEMAAGIINGYPVLTGCSMYVGKGSIRGSGANAYVRGTYDGRGGHSTCRLGIWNHPDDGLLIAYSNQWPTETYPKDPAGLGRCCCWLPLDGERTMLSQYGGGNGETMLLSKLPAVPARPALLDWFV